MNPDGIVSKSAPIIQITGNGDTHRSTNGAIAAQCKKLKPSTRKAETGAFPLLYPYSDDLDPFDMDLHLHYNVDSSCTGLCSVNGNID